MNSEEIYQLSGHRIVLHRFQEEREGNMPLELISGAVPHFRFPCYDKFPVTAAFTTKFGGVSEGYFAEMNMAALKEKDEIIQENYRRILNTLNLDEKRVVLSWQTHTTNVRTVTEEDAGKGIYRPRDYIDTDGLITNVPGLSLVTLYADCVPLYFYDPVHHAIGLSHAGWRGTVHKMAESTLRAMKKTFHSEPSEIIAAIGPCICRNCYEVGEDVAEEFRMAFSIEKSSRILKSKGNGKYLLDLMESNRQVMIETGVLPGNIHLSDICTRCNSDLLFSHRAVGNKRGLLGAVFCLK